MKLLILASLVILILPVVAGTHAIIEGNNWFGCSRQSDYRLLAHYQQEGDLKVFNQALSDAIQHMRATKFRSGESVYIESTTSDLVQLRRPGDVREFWTDKEAIRRL